MPSTNHLLKTERSLVTLFVGGAFLFLIFFELFFIVSRSIFENKFQTETFETAIMRMSEKREKPEGKMQHGPRFPIGIGFIIIDNSGNIIENKLLGPENNGDIGELVDRDTLVAISTGGTYSVNGVLLRKIAIPENELQFRVFIGKGGYPLEDIIRDIFRFLAMDILILLPFWFMGRYFVRQTLKPVEENMNTMAHFINDAGHELKTPLAIISGNLQLLRDSKKPNPEDIESSIKTIESMCDSLDGLLELTKLSLSENKTTLNLYTSLESTIEQHKKEIEGKHLELSLECPKTATIRASYKHFSILFSNLLENAIRYNKEDGRITIRFESGNLTIEDTGIGMDKEDVKKIFDRFYRVDRSGKFPGSGIGLSIVDRIVRLYGWKIEVQSEPGKGSIFTLKVK